MILRLLAQPLQARLTLSEIFISDSQRVYALCLSMTRDASVAEDLTQEVFIHLGRSDRFVEKATSLPWLHRLTVNQVLRHTKRQKEHVLDPLEMVQMHSSGKGKSTSGSPMADNIALDAAVDQLPPGSRAVFLLFSVEGYKHEEIASIFGCSVGNSKSQLHKARKKLKRLLIEQRKTSETTADVELNYSLRTPIRRIGSMP